MFELPDDTAGLFLSRLRVLGGFVIAFFPPSLPQQQLDERQAALIGNGLRLALQESMLLVVLCLLLLLGGLIRPDLVLHPERATRARVLLVHGCALVLSFALLVVLLTRVPASVESRRRSAVATSEDGASEGTASEARAVEDSASEDSASEERASEDGPADASIASDGNAADGTAAGPDGSPEPEPEP